MIDVIGVRFKQAGKIYYFDPGEFEVKSGESVIVETIRGIEFGQVMIERRELSEEKITQPLKKVIRVAIPEDELQLNENQDKEKKAFGICLQKIEHHQLEMKLVDVEYTFDRSKIIFYFTADGRIDFRELVKDLAAVFRTRIELRQIGVRDEAKMLGGLGPCGRPLCCATFLGDFEPVSIKMAKEQNLSLNPVKISGICSRLMCCLKFESNAYREHKNDLPLVGGMVIVDGLEGHILATDSVKETLLVKFADGTKREVVLAEVEQLILENEEKRKLANPFEQECKCSNYRVDGTIQEEGCNACSCKHQEEVIQKEKPQNITNKRSEYVRRNRENGSNKERYPAKSTECFGNNAPKERNQAKSHENVASREKYSVKSRDYRETNQQKELEQNRNQCENQTNLNESSERRQAYQSREPRNYRNQREINKDRSSNSSNDNSQPEA